MPLRDDLDRAAAAAARFAGAGEKLAGVVPAEAEPGERTYLCAFVAGEERTWLVLGDATLRLEQALGDSAGSPFAEAMRQGLATVEELAHDVESSYKLQLA